MGDPAKFVSLPLKDGKRRMINKNHIKSVEEGDKETGSVVHWCTGALVRVGTLFGRQCLMMS